MRKIKLLISYIGTKYCGWQVQPNGVSVQALLQEAFQKILRHEVDIVGASRTDAGVHALAQAAHVMVEGNIPCEGLKKAVNAILPGDIAIMDARDVDGSFHARNMARGKRYVYRIVVSGNRIPHLSNLAWFLPFKPDLQLMRETASVFVGEHDFESFKASGCGSRHAVRMISKIEFEEGGLQWPCEGSDAKEIKIVFEGNGFVRHMIRNITGLLVEAGRGKISRAEAEKILEARDRTKAPACAPAEGLYLMEVFY